MRQFNERGFKWKGGGIADPKVLDVIRKALGPVPAEAFADGVGHRLVQDFNSWPDSGERDLFDAAHATLYPISEQLFGPSFSESSCPHLREQVEVLDRTVGGAIYEDTFVGSEQEDYNSSLKGLEDAVIAALGTKANTLDSAPLLKATFGDKPVPAKWGKFGTSNVWAAQGNTIPATFWTVAFILSNPEFKTRMVTEADAVFADQPDAQGHFDCEKLDFTEICLKEALRLKGTGAEFRTVLKDHELTTSSGEKFIVRAGETLYSSAYFTHHEERIYEKPEEFMPDRWEVGTGGGTTRLAKGDLPEYSYMPFGAGMHVCAGRFLARAEILIFIALLFRNFDCELVGAIPKSNWRNAIGVVKPAGKLRIKFTRRRV
jgi:hypothetical protein